jgi:hypothetical protein
MIFKGDSAVVSDHEDIPFFHPPGGKVPIPSIPDVPFFDLLAVHIKNSVPELDFLPLQGHNSFEKHDPGPGKPDVHHLESLRLGKEVAPPPAKVKIPLPIRRFHAASLNPERKAGIAEKKGGAKAHQPGPDEEPNPEFGKEEKADGSAGAVHVRGNSSGKLFCFRRQERRSLHTHFLMPCRFHPLPKNKKQNP